MVKISLDVSLGEDNFPHISYTPRAGADFNPIDITIPIIREVTYSQEDWERPDLAAERVSDEIRFRKEVEDNVRDCCGLVACQAYVTLAVSNMLNNPGERIIAGATLTCDASDCPLNPPFSGDREPFEPAPQPPRLQAEAEIPLSY
jgi:hypothetical protein